MCMRKKKVGILLIINNDYLKSNGQENPLKVLATAPVQPSLEKAGEESGEGHNHT